MRSFSQDVCIRYLFQREFRFAFLVWFDTISLPMIPVLSRSFYECEHWEADSVCCGCANSYFLRVRKYRSYMKSWASSDILY